MTRPERLRVIIDTDPGIDDAIAILFALRHPWIEVAALTTVAGNIGLRIATRNAGRIAALAGSAVSVHAGAAASIGRAPRPGTAIHGPDGLGGVAFPEPARPAGTDAVAETARLIAASPPGVLDLFCLGPLTNLALLVERAPEAARRLRCVIAMGGAVDVPGNSGPRAEFNVAHDPEAAARVLAADLPLTLIPLDATRRLRADAAYVATLRAAGADPATAAAALIEAYFASSEAQAKGAGSRPLHDPCVPLLALRPDHFRIRRRGLAVEPGTGALVPGPHEVDVAMDLDAPALRALLREGLAA